MNLEEVNSEYLKAKSAVEREKELIRNYATSLENQADYVTLFRGKVAEAKINQDSAKRQIAEQDLQKAIQKVQAIEYALKESKEKIKILQEKINDRFNEVYNNPEIKKHLDKVMESQYERKITKLNDEKDAVERERGGQINLRQLVSGHPTLMNNLKGIMVAKLQIRKFNEELEKLRVKQQNGKDVYTDTVRTQEIRNVLIPQAQEKLNTNKQNLMDFITRNSISILESDIDESLPNNPSIDPNGNINVDATLNGNIKRLNKRIKGIDKTIGTYEIALNNTRDDMSKLNTTPQQTNGQASPNQADNTQQTLDQISSTSKPKWYQFVKRFKNWRERRRQSALPDFEKVDNGIIDAEVVDDDGNVIPNPKQGKNNVQPSIGSNRGVSAQTQGVNQSQQSTPTNGSNQKDSFADSLKYDIVRDVFREQSQTNIDIANQQRKGINPNQQGNGINQNQQDNDNRDDRS